MSTGQTDTMKKTVVAAEVVSNRSHVVGMRHVQALITLFGISVAFIIRQNLSVAVVQMSSSADKKIVMDSEEKAFVLSSFFWGYGLLQIVYGHIGRKGYAVKMFVFGNIAGGILSIALPYIALNYGPTGICIVRFFTGLVQGSIYPNMYNLVVKWVVPQERESVGNIVYTGNSVGSLIAMALSGFLGYNYDWPSIFYATGLIAIVFGVIHLLSGGEGPENYKYISADEREYMRQCFKKEDKQVHETKAAVPWTGILTSVPFYALTICTWCSAWGVWTVAILTPSFISGALKFNLADDGLLSALPHVCSCLVSLLVSIISVYLKRKHNLPLSVLRPFWNSIAMYGAAAALMTLAYAKLNASMAITLLVVIVSISVCNNIGHQMNHLDLSPNFTGVLLSIANTTANTASILGPLISTYLLKDTTDMLEWRVVFVLAAAITFIGNTVFLFWGSTEKQPWDVGRQPGTSPA